MALLLCSLILAVAIFAQRPPTSDAAGGKSEKDLRRDLFYDYDKNVRPVRKWTSAVPLGIEVKPMRIKSMDEKEQLISLDTYMILQWTDEYLQWNPEKYDNITVVNVPSTEIWRPDIALYSGSPDSAFFPVVRTNALIFNTGRVMWAPPFTLNSRCPVPSKNLSPGRSIVECIMPMGSWTYSGKKLDMQLLEDKVDLSNFQDTNHEWKLVKMVTSREDKIYPCCPEAYPLIYYNVTLKKRPNE